MHLALRPGHRRRAWPAASCTSCSRRAWPTATISPATATRRTSWSAICAPARPPGPSAITGLPEAEIVAFARLYGGTKRAFLRLGYGFTRSRNGAAAMHAASCLPVVTGAWQHEGGGALYNFGELYHWDKTMIEGLDARDRSRPRARPVADRPDPGRRARGAGRRRAGPCAADPEHQPDVHRPRPRQGAPRLRARRPVRGGARAVHDRHGARMADIVLPATMFLEHADIYQAGAHPTIQVHKPILEPFAECRTNHFVICELARAPGCRASRLRHDRVGADRRSAAPLRLARRRDRPRRRRLEHRARLPQGPPSRRLPDAGRPLPLQARLGEPRPARPPDAEAARPHAGRRRADAGQALPPGGRTLAPVPELDLHRDADLA